MRELYEWVVVVYEDGKRVNTVTARMEVDNRSELDDVEDTRTELDDEYAYTPI
jgi:hypothetical protein